MRLIRLSGLIIISVLIVAACTTESPSDQVDWRNGAKLAWVVSAYSPESAKSDLPPCLASLPSSELASRHFVIVRYRHVRQTYDETAELPAASQATIGDKVELWPADCSSGQISRITRIFHSVAQ